jgi:LPS export ABC transporter protein LptC
MAKDRAVTFPLLILPFLFFVSCSLDYSQAILPEDLSEKVPETVLLKFKQTNVDKYKITQLLEADKAESFTKTKQTVFENLHYTEYDSDGVKIIEGKANQVIYQTETEDAEISGNIWFHSYTEKTSIYTESLSWKKKEKLLTSKPDQIVRVVKEDGSYIQGAGFETDLRLKQIVFTRGVFGTYKQEKKEETNGTPVPDDQKGKNGQ